MFSSRLAEPNNLHTTAASANGAATSSGDHMSETIVVTIRDLGPANEKQKQNRTNPEYRKSLRMRRVESAIALYRMEPRSLSDRLIPGDDSSSAFGDVMVDDATERPDDRVMRLELSARIDRVMRECLSPREERVIRARFDFDGELTLQQIGDRYGLSRERIRQVQVEALGKLRRALRHV